MALGGGGGGIALGGGGLRRGDAAPYIGTLAHSIYYLGTWTLRVQDQAMKTSRLYGREKLGSFGGASRFEDTNIVQEPRYQEECKFSEDVVLTIASYLAALLPTAT